MVDMSEMENERFFKDVQNCPEIKKQYDPIHEFFMNISKMKSTETESKNSTDYRDTASKHMTNILGLVTGYKSQRQDKNFGNQIYSDEMLQFVKDSRTDEDIDRGYNLWFKRGMQFYNILNRDSIPKICNSANIPLDWRFINLSNLFAETVIGYFKKSTD